MKSKESIKFQYVRYETQKGKEGIQIYEFDTETSKEYKVKGGFHINDDEVSKANLALFMTNSFNQKMAEVNRKRHPKGYWTVERIFASARGDLK